MSFATILPLFVSSVTASPILIGLIPAIHNTGWQLPQLFIAGWVSRKKRIKPVVVSMTSLERVPYLGLALVALMLPSLGVQTALVLIFTLLIIQGLGAGLTASPWQVMIGKIIPGERRGTFFGAQSGIANLLAALGAVIAGQILSRSSGSLGFAWCFLIGSMILGVSWVFLSLTASRPIRSAIWGYLRWNNPPNSPRQILREDHNFRWFLVARLASQLGLMGFAFYSIYAVNHYGVSAAEIGWMTGVLMISNFAASLSMGWMGDRWGHRQVMILGWSGCLAAPCLPGGRRLRPGSSWSSSWPPSATLPSGRLLSP